MVLHGQQLSFLGAAKTKKREMLYKKACGTLSPTKRISFNCVLVNNYPV